jgi:Ca2+-binding EF-hand superfamily protein
MGAKGSKGKSNLKVKKAKLSKKDYKFLTQQSGMKKEQIDELFVRFNDNNPDGQLDKAEFAKLYNEIRPEPAELLDEISRFVFGAFDADNSGSISFSEFLVAYSLTTKGDIRSKLEYAFELYDADDSGTLDRTEIKTVLTGMLDLLGADKKGHNINSLTTECMKELDQEKDGLITKDEFVDGLLANYSLRALMSPFN